MSKKTTKTNLELGAEVFDNYINAKKILPPRSSLFLNNGYTNVRIFCSGKEPRRAHFANVVSLWKDTAGKRGEEFQQVKDVAMTEECDIAIGFWDGTSRGTKANIDRCKKLGKPCKVFLTPLFQKSKETNPTNFV